MKRVDDIAQLQHNLLELEQQYEKLQLAHQLLALEHEALKTSKNLLVESVLSREAREKKHTTIIENSPAALFLSGPDGNLLEANRTACEMFGYTEEEFRRLKREQLIDAEDILPDTPEKNNRQTNAPKPVTAVKKNGDNFQVEVSAVMFKDLVSGENRTSLAITEITDLLRIEQALLESVNDYKTLFDLNPLPMWIYDLETTKFLAVNAAAVRHYGYTREEFLQMTIADIRPPEETERLYASVDNIQIDAKSGHGHWKHWKKNREIIYVEITAQLLSYTGRKATLVLANDITRRIHVESKLIKSNRRLRAAQQIAQLGYWELNLSTFELYLSEQAYAILGLHPAEFPVTYETFFALVHPEDQDDFAKKTAAFKDAASLSVTHRVLLQNGVIKTVIENGNPIYNEAGIAVMFEGTIQDITERKKDEQIIADRERRMKNAQYVGSVGDWEYDCSTGKLNWSDELFRLFAKDPANQAPQLEEFISLYAPNNTVLKNCIHQALTNGTNYEIDLQLSLPSKPDAFHYSVGQVLKDAQGTIVKLYGIVQDITERKLAEIKLAAERNQLRTLIDTLPDSIYIKDTAGRKIITNKVDRQLMGGITAEEALGKTDLDIFANELGIKSYADDMEVIRTGKGILNREECFNGENGSRTWLLTSKVPIRNAAGEIDGLLGIGRIITERREAEEALRESNERYLYATKATFDAIWDWDIINDHLYWGEGYEKIFGYKIPDNIENQIHSFNNIHPDDKPSVFADINTLLDGDELNWTSEYRYRKASGEYAYVQDKGIIIRDQTGKAIRMIGAMQDVTERKAAEESSKRTQEKFTSLVNTVDGIVWEADATNFAFTYVSKHAEKLLGYTTGEWVSDPLFWANHIHPDDRDWAVKYCIECTHNKKEHQFEYRMIAADGRVVWLADFVTVVVENDEAAQLRGIMVDITERKKTEEALIKERKLLRVLIDNLPDYIYVKDINSRHIINNKANVTLLGFHSEHETIDKTIVELLGEKVASEFMKDDLSVLKSGQPIIDREEPIYDHNGKERWLLTTKIPFRNENNEITGLVGISRDITERKKTEEEIKEKNIQLKNLSNHLQDIREEERKILAREVHDELGQLASVVKMDIDWLTLRLTDISELPRKRIQHASSTADMMINTIRKIASTLRPSMLDELGLNASLAWQCKEFSSVNGIPCSFEETYSDEHLPVVIKTELFRICQESLTNVMRHAAATQVWVNIHDTKEGIQLSIRDNGKGFDTTRKTGTLGLIGMRERVLSINGRLSIQSKPGKGTTICAIIPNNTITI